VRTTAQNAELALLLEVSSTPKPGNVDREREYPDLRFEHFVAGAVGAADGLTMAADGAPLGDAFHRAIEGMAAQRGGNTQFGAILLQLPLVAAAGEGSLDPEGATTVVETTTVADAAGFYRAFDVVDVAVDDPPDDIASLDVRRGSEAIPELEARGLTLADVMDRSAAVDGVAREWVAGFERTFGAADEIRSRDGPVTERAADVFLELLGDRVDTFVVKQHDEATARRTTERARAALDGDVSPTDLAEEFVDAEINPGTTADIVAGALFVALERGITV
jgi:triphosphoribosyl-dephospho-CoA synthase